jgi:hypothetical protein
VDKAEACTCPGVPAGTETFRCDSPDICGGKLPCVGANGKGACRAECCNDWTSCEANLGKQATCGATEICSCPNGIQCGNDGRCTCTGGVGTLGYCFPK